MTTSSIVCGVDATQHARVALGVAERLARKLGLRLAGWHVAGDDAHALMVSMALGKLAWVLWRSG